MSHRSRPCAGEADLGRMRRFLVEARAAGGQPGPWHVGDLAWGWFLHTIRFDPARTIRLWESAAGRLLGFAWFTPDKGWIDWQVDPRESGRGLEDDMLAWAEECRAELGRGEGAGEVPALEARSLGDDSGRIAALERHGFVRTHDSFVHMLRVLAADDPIPPARPPDGFVVRPLAGRHEAPSRAAAHREAFHPSRVTDEHYARLMELPGYDRDLDLVAVGPDGQVAAFALCWMDEANRIGEFEPVGTRPAYQRRGLARAVLLEGMRRMRARGAERALVLADEAAPVKLYESAGFRIANREYGYRRRS